MTQGIPATSTGAVTSFLELSPDAVAIVDENGLIVNVNDVFLRLSGHQAEDVMGQPIEMLVPKRLRAGHQDTRESFTQDPTVRPMGVGRELWMLTAAGQEVAVDIALRPIPTETGGHVAAVIRDVTAARETQNRLEHAEAQLRGMLDAHLDGIAVMRAVRDADGALTDMVIEFANLATGQILGIPHTRLIGMSVSDLTDPKTAEFLDYAQLFKTGEPITHIAQWHDPVTTKLVAVLEVKGALAGPNRVVAAFRNIIEQRRDQERIEQMNEALVAANGALEDAASFQRDFISASSHELRTPLTAMTGFAELLVDRWDEMGDARRRDAATAILRNAKRQLALVNDLAHAAHLQSGRLQLDVTRVALDSVITEASRSVAGADAFEPSAASGLMVLADEGRLIQIVINLISNALRYGKPPYRIEAQPTELGLASVGVVDGGDGVPEAFVPHLFDAFAQASRGSRRESKGTGLGLYISKSLAEAMHGDLHYAPGPNGESRFEITVPLSEVQ